MKTALLVRMIIVNPAPEGIHKLASGLEKKGD